MSCISFTPANRKSIVQGLLAIQNDISLTKHSLINLIDKLVGKMIEQAKGDSNSRFMPESDNPTSINSKVNQVERLILTAYLTDVDKANSLLNVENMADKNKSTIKSFFDKLHSDSRVKEINKNKPKVPVFNDNQNRRLKLAMQILEVEWFGLSNLLNNLETPVVKYNSAKSDITDIISMLEDDVDITEHEQKVALYLITGALPIKYTDKTLATLGVEKELVIKNHNDNGVFTFKVYEKGKEKENEHIGELFSFNPADNTTTEAEVANIFQSLDGDDNVKSQYMSRYGISEIDLGNKLKAYRDFKEKVALLPADNSSIPTTSSIKHRRKGNILKVEGGVTFRELNDLQAKEPNLAVSNTLKMDTRPYIPNVGRNPDTIATQLKSSPELDIIYQELTKRNPYQTLRVLSETLGTKGEQLAFLGELAKLKDFKDITEIEKGITAILNNTSFKNVGKALENGSKGDIFTFLIQHVQMLGLGLTPNPTYMGIYKEYEYNSEYANKYNGKSLTTDEKNKRLDAKIQEEGNHESKKGIGRIMLSFDDDVVNMDYSKITSKLKDMYAELSKELKNPTNENNKENIDNLNAKIRYVCKCYFKRYHLDRMIAKGTLNGVYIGADGKNKEIEVPTTIEQFKEMKKKGGNLVADNVFYLKEVKDDNNKVTREEITFNPEGFINLIYKIRAKESLIVLRKDSTKGQKGDLEGQNLIYNDKTLEKRLDDYFTDFKFNFSPNISDFKEGVSPLHQNRTINLNNTFIDIDTEKVKQGVNIDFTEMKFGGKPAPPNISIQIYVEEKVEQQSEGFNYTEQDIENILDMLIQEQNIESKYEISSDSMKLFQAEIPSLKRKINKILKEPISEKEQEGKIKELKNSLAESLKKSLKSEKVICK